MKGLNKVTLIGALGRDPEVRYTPEGNAIAKFSIATSDLDTNGGVMLMLGGNKNATQQQEDE